MKTESSDGRKQGCKTELKIRFTVLQKDLSVIVSGKTLVTWTLFVRESKKKTQLKPSLVVISNGRYFEHKRPFSNSSLSSS